MQLLQFLATLASILGGAIAMIVAVTRHKKLAVKISSHFLLASSTLFIVGYITNQTGLYTLPKDGTPVSLPMAICVFVIGGCLWILSNGQLAFESEQKELSATALSLRQVADVCKNTPCWKKANAEASEAERVLSEHESKRNSP